MINLQDFLNGIGFTAKYPYTDIHELNLDWCLAQIAKLRVEFDDFAHVNSLKYAGEWDITKAYSAFSVVDDQGFGYMALKPVPPGTQINDAEYWLMVVDYSQLIVDVEDRLVALENTVGDSSSGLVKDVDDLQNAVGDSSSGLVKDVDDLKNTVGDASNGLVKDVDDLQNAVGDASSGLVKDVDDLKNAVGDASSGLVKDVDDLKNTVGDASNGLVKDVDDLQTDVSTLRNSVIGLNISTMTMRNRKFLFQGDSYGAPTYGNWIGQTISILNLQPGEYINLAYPGGAFTATPGTVDNWLYYLQINTISMSQDEKDEITDFILLGGINDSRPWSEMGCSTAEEAYDYIKNAIRTYAAYVQTNFPNALITLGWIGNVRDSTDRRKYNLVANALKAWIDAAGECTNVRFVNNFQWIMHDYDYMQPDGIHPTEEGGGVIANACANVIRGGNVCFDRDISGNFVLVKVGQSIDSRISNVSYQWQMGRVTNNVTYIDFGKQMSVEFNNLSSNITISNGDRIKIMQSRVGWVWGKPGMVEIPCRCVWYDRTGSDTTAKEFMSVDLVLEEGDLYLRFNSVSFNYTINSVNATQLVVYPTPLTLDTMVN